MRSLLSSLFLLGLSILAEGQILSPVKWSYSAKKVGTGIYEVRLTASIEKGWHIYSQTTPDGGPVPTSITLQNPLLTMDGTAKEVGKLEQKFEELFGVTVRQFSDKVDFVQKVKLKGSAKTAVSGSVEFMACNDEMCLPPGINKFSVALK